MGRTISPDRTLVVSVTSAYTATCSVVVLADATSGALVVTLPAVAPGLVVTVKKTDSSANAVTPTRAGSALIDGATTFPLTVQYQSVDLVCDGTNWWVL